MYEFSQPRPNVIASSSGHKLRILGRAGLRLDIGEYSLDIDSEMLDPPMSLVIYAASIPSAAPLPPGEILEEVVKALHWAGFQVEVI